MDEINQNKNYINSNISNIKALEKELQENQFLNAFDEINSDLPVDNVDINEEKDELNINILKDNNFKENTKKKINYPKTKKRNYNECIKNEKRVINYPKIFKKTKKDS